MSVQVFGLALWPRSLGQQPGSIGARSSPVATYYYCTIDIGNVSYFM